MRYVYMCICAYVYVCLHMFLYICIYVYKHKYTHIYMHIHICVYVYMFTERYILGRNSRSAPLVVSSPHRDASTAQLFPLLRQRLAAWDPKLRTLKSTLESKLAGLKADELRVNRYK